MSSNHQFATWKATVVVIHRSAKMIHLNEEALDGATVPQRSWWVSSHGWYIYIIYIYGIMDMAQTWRTKVAQKILHAASRHSYLSLIFEAHGQHAEIELPCQGLRSWPSGILQAGCIKGVMAIPSWFKIHPNGTPAVLGPDSFDFGPHAAWG